MASYEQSGAAVDNAINDALNQGTISQTTADAIKDIVNQLGGASANVEIANVETGVLTDAAIAAPIIMMGADASANVEFAADSPVQAMVVGGGGESNVVFQTSDNVTVQLSGGMNDSVQTADGHDTVTFAGGSATIGTGTGNDTVVLDMDKINMDDPTTSASIDAGDGFDSVSIGASHRADLFFSFVNGVFRMVKQAITGRDGDIAAQADAGQASIDMTNVNVVTFTDSEGNIEGATILADTDGEAAVGRIYNVVYGREGVDSNAQGTNVDGIDFWFETYGASKDMTADQLNDLSRAMVGSSEFDAKYGSMDAQAFADAMFKNVNDLKAVDVTTINEMTAADFANAINSGQMTKQDVAVLIANSDAAVQALEDSQNMVTSDGI